MTVWGFETLYSCPFWMLFFSNLILGTQTDFAAVAAWKMQFFFPYNRFQQEITAKIPKIPFNPHVFVEGSGIKMSFHRMKSCFFPCSLQCLWEKWGWEWIQRRHSSALPLLQHPHGPAPGGGCQDQGQHHFLKKNKQKSSMRSTGAVGEGAGPGKGMRELSINPFSSTFSHSDICGCINLILNLFSAVCSWQKLNFPRVFHALGFVNF